MADDLEDADRGLGTVWMWAWENKVYAFMLRDGVHYARVEKVPEDHPIWGGCRTPVYYHSPISQIAQNSPGEFKSVTVVAIGQDLRHRNYEFKGGWATPTKLEWCGAIAWMKYNAVDYDYKELKKKYKCAKSRIKKLEHKKRK